MNNLEINRYRLTNEIDLANSTGLEIGPLVNPIVTRMESNVKYVDRASTAELRSWYADESHINVEDIAEIDYIWGEQSLAEATACTEQFDYCIASHVIEHIPDLITWLGEIASVLKTGAVACFAVPDKRYTFDYLRPETTIADLVDNYLNKLRRPSFRHIYDHFLHYAQLHIEDAWSDGYDGSDLEPFHDDSFAYAACLEAIKTDKYVDCHCTVITQDSFLPLLGSISKLGLLDFRVKRIFHLKHGMFEFVVQLEKIDAKLSQEQKYQAFKDSMQLIDSISLVMNFTSNIPCSPKLYYDSGRGFNEVETEEIRYRYAGQPMQLRFPLPKIDELRLRFDPAEHACKFQISQLCLETQDGSTSLRLDALQPLNQIVDTTRHGDEFSATTTAQANDPSLLIVV